MPHWTIPSPAPDDPVADAAKAISSLQTQLDSLFAANITVGAIDDVSSHVRTFTKEFEANAAEARSRLAGS
jgi:flagellin-like hook-associated protein FlgL